MNKKQLIVGWILVLFLLSGCANLSNKNNITTENTKGFDNRISNCEGILKTLLKENVSLDNMKLNINFWLYLAITIVLSILLRALFSLFKAAGIQRGEAGGEYIHYYFWKDAFLKSLSSSEKSFKIDDLFLPTLIGFLELFSYPFIMKAKLWYMIGAWITIKTAVHWGKWTETRTPFNRYLFANALVLFISYLFSRWFIG